MVRTGDFDRVLVRPQSEIIQVLGSKFELTRIGRMIQAIVMFVYGIMNSDVVWTIPKVLTILFMLIGGTAVFVGLFLIYAALCFFTLDGLEFMNVFTDGAREFGKYPIGIYGKKVLLFTTFFVPYALIQHYYCGNLALVIISRVDSDSCSITEQIRYGDVFIKSFI